MAKQTINIGSAANDGTGDPLRTAFDKVNDNFTELYSDDLGDVGSIIAGTGISVDSATGNVTVTNSSPDQTVALTGGTGITTSGTYPNFTVASTIIGNATHTGDVTGATALTISADAVDGTKIADDAVDHDHLSGRYTASSAVTSATAITLDTATADVFTWTAGHSTTVAFTNVKVGSTCAVVITGGGSSYTLALGNINGSSGTFNKLGGTYDDTSSTKNLIEFKFISTTEAWYQISQIAS